LDLEYYCLDGLYFVSDLPGLPLPTAEKPGPTVPLRWLFDREPSACRATFCVSDLRQLSAVREDIRFLSPNRIAGSGPSSPRLQKEVAAQTLQAVNIRHPRWRDALRYLDNHADQKRVNLLAVGDVGGTLLTALKLMGSEVISSIGICDLNEKNTARWVAEMGQISWPDNSPALPVVEAVAPENLFDCDIVIFAATKSIPAVGSGVADVRMAQFEANHPIVEHYARLARSSGFRGLFLVMSDPVDPLCRAAYLASNRGSDGEWDGQGLLPEQIQGLGLGVMNARAADLARREDRFSSFLQEGRCFGPHGKGLIVTNSIDHYDDALSLALTQEVLEANLRIRELGYKPYVAPAISSGAMQLFLLMRGQWHYGSVCLGGVWMGCRNRFAAAGLETEALHLPDALFARLVQTETALRSIL
jgi:hypothetical protein